MNGIFAALLILTFGGTTLAQEDRSGIYDELYLNQSVEIEDNLRSITFSFEAEKFGGAITASGEARLVRRNVYEDQSIIYIRVRGRTRKLVCRVRFTFSGENLENLTVGEDRNCLSSPDPLRFPLAGRYKLRE